MPHRQIAAAITAHELWNTRLSRVVDQGVVAADVQAAARIDLCDFGRWLASPAVPPELRRHANFREAARLHAIFHDAAARALRAFAEQHLLAAAVSLNAGGEYSEASRLLIAHMRHWEAALAAERDAQ